MATNQLAVGVVVFLALWALALWTVVWWVLALAWVAAMTGDVTRAAAGRTTASVAIVRLNEVITSVCSEWVVKAQAG